MDTALEKFSHFIICRRGGGESVVLRQTPTSVVFLAFDLQVKRLVELHVLKGTALLSQADRQEVLEQCRLATEVRGPGCMRVLDAGEDDETVFFASNLSDGERAEDYVQRRGAMPQVTVFCLMQQFLEDLLNTPKFDEFVTHVSVVNPLITMLEDSFLQLRIVDYKLGGKPIPNASGSTRRFVAECCHLLFLLLTGQPFDGQNPDQFPALTCLPTNLRSHLRAALIDEEQASPHIEKLRDDVREAYSALVSNLQVRTSRRHIVVTELLQPKSQLKELLLDNVPVDELFSGRFEVCASEDTRHPFSIAAVNVKTDQQVTVHLLPPSGIVPKDQYEAVPLQMWRFNSDKHPNILRSLSVWENPAWTFLTEEREPGFSLGRLLAERLTLNPAEVLILLQEVLKGLNQATECGVRKVDLHPSNLLFRVGKGGAMQAREFERLVQKRLDAWPPFVLKLRTHTTMRGLYEPPLAEAPEGSHGKDSHLMEREVCHQSLIALAIYLLTGERQAGKEPQFGETISEPLARYLRRCADASSGEAPPLPSDFVQEFEKLMGQPSPEGRGFAAIMAASGETNAEFEDAGTISDFDEDGGDFVVLDDSSGTSRTSTTPSYLLSGNGGRRSFSVNSLPAESKTVPGRLGMFIWGGAGILLLLLARFALFSGGNSASLAAQSKPATPSVVHAASQPTSAAQFSSAPKVASATTTPVADPRPVTAQPTSSSATVSSDKQPAEQPPLPPANAPASPGKAAPPADTPVIIKRAIVPAAQEIGNAKPGPSGAATPAESSISNHLVETGTKDAH